MRDADEAQSVVCGEANDQQRAHVRGSRAHSRWVIGQPDAVRAVGRANGDNRIAIIIPCHRVVGSDGKLTGYGGGLWRKQYLLSLEQSESFTLS